MNFIEVAKSQFGDRLREASEVEAKVRQRAWADFEARGLPGRRSSRWRYSSTQALVQGEWVPVRPSAAPAAALALRDRWRDHFDVLMVVDGEARPADSALSEETRSWVGVASPGENVQLDDGFVSLATAAAGAGWSIRLPKDARPARPLLVVAVQTGAFTFASAFNALHLGPNAALDLAVIHVGDGSYFRSEVNDVKIDAGARLRWVRVNEDDRRARHFSETAFAVGRDACLNLAQINAGGAITRAGLRVELDQSGGEAHVFGVNFARDLQHVDQRIEINHHAAHTNSSQLFKGVLRDRAKGILNGKIFIAKHAQKVISSQYNHNLLLSGGAEANTHPELEIYADDVKANHGASIGRMDEDRIFYLMSRGLRRDYAQRLLAQAFVSDVVMKMDSAALRPFIDERVADILPSYL